MTWETIMNIIVAVAVFALAIECLVQRARVSALSKALDSQHQRHRDRINTLEKRGWEVAADMRSGFETLGLRGTRKPAMDACTVWVKDTTPTHTYTGGK